MATRPAGTGWLIGPIVGLLVILASVWLVRQTSRTVEASLREAARREALAAANGAAHTAEIYFEERAAEAEYLAELCADGSIRSNADLESFGHTIAESHDEYLGFRWRSGADGASWSRPAGFEPILSGAAPMMDSALQELSTAPAGSFAARILVGRDPSTGDPIIGILKPVRGAGRPGGILYAESVTSRLAQVLTVPFYKGRFGYRVSVAGQTIWNDGGALPEGPDSGTTAEFEAPLFQEQMKVMVWFLPGADVAASRLTRAAQTPGLVLSLLVGIAAAALVEWARRAQRRAGQSSGRAVT